MRRWRRELLIAAVLVPVLAGLALVSLRNGASPASTVAPSARPTANSFGSAYVAFLNNRLGAAAVPAVTAASRSLVSTGGRVPAAYRAR
jgi:hypothetical protein